MAYATVAQLEAFTGVTAPVDASLLLERASEIVASHVTRWVQVDVNRTAVDLVLAGVLADATCAQAVGGFGEESSPSAQSSIDGVILSPGEAAGESTPATGLAPQALAILRGAGLVGGSISTWG